MKETLDKELISKLGQLAAAALMAGDAVAALSYLQEIKESFSALTAAECKDCWEVRALRHLGLDDSNLQNLTPDAQRVY